MVVKTRPSPTCISIWWQEMPFLSKNKMILEIGMNNVIDVILARRSIRKYTDQPVSKEILETLVKAAMAAPSAMNAQPWEFVVITEPKTLASLRGSLIFAKINAPAVICVLGSERMQKNKTGSRFWVQDCSAAAENILVAATSM